MHSKVSYSKNLSYLEHPEFRSISRHFGKIIQHTYHIINMSEVHSIFIISEITCHILHFVTKNVDFIKHTFIYQCRVHITSLNLYLIIMVLDLILEHIHNFTNWPSASLIHNFIASQIGPRPLRFITSQLHKLAQGHTSSQFTNGAHKFPFRSHYMVPQTSYIYQSITNNYIHKHKCRYSTIHGDKTIHSVL